MALSSRYFWSLWISAVRRVRSLSSTIGTGEGLLIEAADTETLAPFNLNAAVIAAKIESLRITFDQWHTEIDPQRQTAVLREVFGGET